MQNWRWQLEDRRPDDTTTQPVPFRVVWDPFTDRGVGVMAFAMLMIRKMSASCSDAF